MMRGLNLRGMYLVPEGGRVGLHLCAVVENGHVGDLDRRPQRVPYLHLNLADLVRHPLHRAPALLAAN